jgi:predicted DCC family thiol-disulfide oxidoreductase YuxK
MGVVMILYDLDCGFCRWSVAQLLRLDARRELRPVAIQSDEGQELLAGVPAQLRLKTAHAVAEDGTVVSGGDAFAMVADRLRFGAPFALVARAAPGPVRLGYRLIAGNRSTVSRLVPASRKAAADRALAARQAELG